MLHTNLVIINLKRSTDRRRKMEDQLKSVSLPFEFFPAIDGRLGEHRTFNHYSEEFCIRKWRRPLTPGEVGCFASHYLLWQRCVEQNLPLLILEDDVVIGRGFESAVRAAHQIVNSIGYVRLSGIRVSESRAYPMSVCAPWSVVRFLRGPLGSQCYAISPIAAGTLLRHADQWDQPVDNYMDSFWRHGILCLGLHPFPVQPSTGIASEISWNGISPSEENRAKVWRPKRFVARKLDDLRRELFNVRYREDQSRI